MKKTILFLAVVLVGNVAMFANKEARKRPMSITESQYGLWIAGVEVTSANKSDIPCPGKAKGTISYNSDDAVLTLNGVEAYIEEDKNFIESDSSLVIQITGTNTIIQLGAGEIYLEGEHNKIQGNGTLVYDNHTLNGWYYGINSSGNLSIEGGGTVKIYGAAYGIHCDDHLSINSSVVYASCSGRRDDGHEEDASIVAGSMTMNGCSIVSPFNATYISEEHAVSIGDGYCKAPVVITPTGTSCGITIAGTDVNQYNMADVLGDGKVKVKKLTSGSYEYEISLWGVLYDEDIDNTNPFISTAKDVRLFVRSGNENDTINGKLQFDGNVEVTGGGLLAVGGSGDGIRFAKNLLFNDNGTRLSINVTGTGLLGTSASSYCELSGVMGVHGDDAAATGATFAIRKNAGEDVARMLTGTISTANRRIEDESGNAATHFVLSAKTFGIFFNNYETQVTLDNYQDVLDDGTVFYNPLEAILKLNNCTIQSTTGDGLTAYQSFRIQLEGNNLIEGVDYGLDVDDYSIYIEGPGSLIARATDKGGIGMYGVGPLKVSDGAHVEAYGQGYGLNCISENLTVSDATLIAQASAGGTASIGSVKNLILEDAMLTSSHTWDAAQHKFLDAGGQEATDKIKISNDYYPIAIAGKYLTEETASSVSFPGQTAGTISYDDDNSTLTFNNVQGSYTGAKPLISTKSDDEFALKVTGTNTITLTNATFMDVRTEEGWESDAMILGGGTLNVNNVDADKDAIYGDDFALSEGTTLNIQSSGHAINGYLYIDNATADLSGDGEYGAVYDIEEMSDCHLTSPDTIAWVNYDFVSIKTGARVYPNHIIIQPGEGTGAKAYAIEFYTEDLGNVYITDSTCSNVVLPMLSSGKIAYNPATKVLTFDNVQLEEHSQVWIGEEGVTLSLIGQNKTSYYPTSNAMITNDNMTIEGSGSLQLGGSLAHEGGLLTIRNTSLSLTDGQILGYEDFDLVIDNSDIEITNGGNRPIDKLKSLTMTNCQFVAPADVFYDEEYGSVRLADNSQIAYFKIERTGTGIEQVHNAQCTMHDARKVMLDGQLLIIHEGKLFNILGVERK